LVLDTTKLFLKFRINKSGFRWVSVGK